MQVPLENKDEAVQHLTAFLETVNAPLKHEIFELKDKVNNQQYTINKQRLEIEELQRQIKEVLGIIREYENK